MKEIAQSPPEIGPIIGVLDVTAFQSSLPVLNAGDESTRTRDAETGLAAAPQARCSRAQPSIGAAGESKAANGAPMAVLGQGIVLFGKTGRAPRRADDRSAEADDRAPAAAASGRRRVMFLNEANAAVNQIDQVPQQNAAMAGDSAAALHSFAQETKELVRLVSKFRIGEFAPAAVASHPALRALAEAPTRTASTRHKPVAAMRVWRTGDGALKTQSKPAPTGRDEF